MLIICKNKGNLLIISSIALYHKYEKHSCIIANSKNIICNMQVAQNNTRHFIIYDLKYIIFVFLYMNK